MQQIGSFISKQRQTEHFQYFYKKSQISDLGEKFWQPSPPPSAHQYYSVPFTHPYPQRLSVIANSPAHVSGMKYVAVTSTRYDGTDGLSVHC